MIPLVIVTHGMVKLTLNLVIMCKLLKVLTVAIALLLCI